MRKIVNSLFAKYFTNYLFYTSNGAKELINGFFMLKNLLVN